jgi:iron(III) transport system ATP-binding protein
VTKKVYLGNILDYRVALGNEEIRVEASSGEEFELGQTVGLRFESYVLFK